MKSFCNYVIVVSFIAMCIFSTTVYAAGDGYCADENIRINVRFEEVPLINPPNRPSDSPWTVKGESLFFATGIENKTVKGVWSSIISVSKPGAGYGLTQLKDGGSIAYLLTVADDSYVKSYGSDLALWMGKIGNGKNIEWLKRFAVIITAEEIPLPTPVILPAPEPIELPQETPEPTVVPLASIPTAIAAGYGWPLCYGGSEDESGYRVVSTTGGGYALIGPTGSIDGDVSGNHGKLDFWLLNLGPEMLPEWERSLGGSREDIGTALVFDPDGGFTVTGLTRSNDGDVSGNYGKQDLWVAKTNSEGTLMWQRCFGGSDDDGGTDIIRTLDGGYIVTGWTRSTDGSIIGLKGGMDAWIIGLGSDHEIEWQLLLGGEGDDILREIIPANDGGYIAVGGSNSAVNMMTPESSTPFTDYWIVKISREGSLEWDTYWGGQYNDEAFGIASTGDDGYLITGYTQSNDGFVDDNHGGRDVWLLGIDNSGMITSKRCYGGTSDDSGLAIVYNDISGTAAITGRTSSNDGDVLGNHGRQDLWVFSVDGSGELLWQRCIGGRSDDSGESIIPIEDGYLISGSTASHDGDVTGNHGKTDVWIVKLGSDGSVNTPATGVGVLFDKYSFVILLLMIVLLMLIGLVSENEWRRKRVGKEPDTGTELRKKAIDLLDELRFEIRRLAVKGVLIPEEITDLTALHEMMDREEYHELIIEARRRIGVMHGIEELFDRAESEIILVEGEVIRLVEKGVIIENRSSEASSLFNEGRYDEAYMTASATIKEMRAAESGYDRAMSLYGLVREESIRLGSKGVIFEERSAGLYEMISSGKYPGALVLGNEILEDLKSVESRFDLAKGAFELLKKETERLKDKGVSISDRSVEVGDLIDAGDYSGAAIRAGNIIEEIRLRESDYNSAKEALATLMNEVERLRQRDNVEDAESQDTGEGGEEK